MPKDSANNIPISLRADNGTEFKATRADLRDGVVVLPSTLNVTELQKMADFAQFGAWHAHQIHPNLNGFSGYDAISYTFG